MRCAHPTAIILFLSQAIAAPGPGNQVMAGERKTPPRTAAAAAGNPLDRIAYAVDGAESSHGSDAAMWRADPSGPQGPMQVSAAAAADVGGGDRFDTTQNRDIGRAYLAQLHRRYGDWPDAIAAYNWGIGNLDSWVKAGRPAGKVVFGVGAYLGRVLHDSGLCDQVARRPARAAAATAPACADLARQGVLGAGALGEGWQPSGLRPAGFAVNWTRQCYSPRSMPAWRGADPRAHAAVPSRNRHAAARQRRRARVAAGLAAPACWPAPGAIAGPYLFLPPDAGEPAATGVFQSGDLHAGYFAD